MTIDGFYWKITDEFHFVRTLEQLVQEVGRIETYMPSYKKLTAYAAIYDGDNSPVKMQKMYPVHHQISIVRRPGFWVTEILFTKMKDAYWYLASLADLNTDIRYSWDGDLIQIDVKFILTETVDWAKEGF